MYEGLRVSLAEFAGSVSQARSDITVSAAAANGVSRDRSVFDPVERAGYQAPAEPDTKSDFPSLPL
jgi:hypothetical protein